MTYRALRAILNAMPEEQLSRPAIVAPDAVVRRIALPRDLFPVEHPVAGHLGTEQPLLSAVRHRPSIVPPEEEWYKHLPEDLLLGCYRHRQERAWPREAALRVLDVIGNVGYAVVSVEVWVPTIPGPTLSTVFYDWDVDVSRISAAEFVSTFAWAPEDTWAAGKPVVFNITAERERDA